MNIETVFSSTFTMDEALDPLLNTLSFIFCTAPFFCNIKYRVSTNKNGEKIAFKNKRSC